MLAFGLSIVAHVAAVMLVLPDRSPSLVVPTESSFELVFEPAALLSEPGAAVQPEQLRTAAPALEPPPLPLAEPERSVPAQVVAPEPVPAQAVHSAPEPLPPVQAVRPAAEPRPSARPAAVAGELGQARRGAAKPQARASGEGAPQAAAVPLIPPSPVAGMEQNRAPAYPASALRRGEQGRVMLRVSVSAEGMPVAVDLAQSSGYPGLDSAALTAVRGWRFNPATRAGQPVPAAAEFPVQFRLSN